MKIWLRRIFALAMISLGIALFFLPFNNTRSGWVEKEIVKLQLEDFLRTDTIEAQFPKVKIVDITGPKMNEEDYPNLWWAFIDLDRGWSADTCEIDEWERFQELVLGEKADTSLILFRGVLSSCIKNRKKNVVSIYYLGEYNLDLKKLSDEDLSRFPNIQKIINELETGSIDEDINSVPVKVWKKFVDRYLEPLNDYQCFYYNKQVYGPDYRTAFDVKEGEIGNLSVFLKIIGFVLLLLGLFVIRKLYFRKRGIMVNPKRVAILYDVIVLLLAVPSAWLTVSILLEKVFFIPPIYEDDEMFFMGVFFFCFGIPFISLFTSRLTSQSVEINSKGILLDSIRTKEFMSWESIQTMEFSDEYVLVGRLGTPIPGKLQKSLKLIDLNMNSILINEPQLKSVKKKITQCFENNVPEELKANFMKIIGKW